MPEPEIAFSDISLRIHCLNLALSKFKQCDIPEVGIEISEMFYNYIRYGYVNQ